MANDSQIIVACAAHPSSETAVVPGLLDRAQTVGPVETVLFNAGIFSDGILNAVEQRDLELLFRKG